MKPIPVNWAQVILFTGGFVLAAMTAQAAAPQNQALTQCTAPFGGGLPPATIINLCSSVIKAGGIEKPYLANAYYARGNGYFGLNNYTAAIADYDAALKLNPQYAKAYNNRGYAYSKQGKDGTALASYNLAIVLDPAYATAYRNRADTRVRLGQFIPAVEDYTKLESLNPQEPNLYFNRGVANYKAGRFAAAIADYDRALQQNPQDKDAASNKAIAVQARDKTLQMAREEQERKDAAEAQAIEDAVNTVVDAYVGSQQSAPVPQRQPQTHAGGAPAPLKTGASSADTCMKDKLFAGNYVIYQNICSYTVHAIIVNQETGALWDSQVDLAAGESSRAFPGDRGRPKVYATCTKMWSGPGTDFHNWICGY